MPMFEVLDDSCNAFTYYHVGACHLKNYFVITYLLKDGKELSLRMLIRCKRIYNFWCSMLFLHQLFNVYVFAMQETNRSNPTPSWPGIGQVARPWIRTCARALRAVARGTRAHQQSWEPPGSSCCSSVLAGGFWQATEVQLVMCNAWPCY